MIDIFRNNIGPFLTAIGSVFGFLHLVVSPEHKNYIKEKIDKFISLDYTKPPKNLAKYALDFIDHVFGLEGDYLPRAFQIIHIGICITAFALFFGNLLYKINYPLLVYIEFNLLFITALMLLGWKRIKTLVHKKYFWYGYLSLAFSF
jgi:hypothetical protein